MARTSSIRVLQFCVKQYRTFTERFEIVEAHLI